MTFRSGLYEALQHQAQLNECSFFHLANEAVRLMPIEDRQDLAAIEERPDEPDLEFGVDSP